MAIVLSILTFSFLACLGAVDSETNITSCTSLLNDQCRQNLKSCPQPPCEFSCGRTEPQRSCSQDCSPSGNLTSGKLCKGLECQATDYCDQSCSGLNCDTTSCTSKDCRQRSVLADSGSMACKQSVVTCDQAALLSQNGQIMTCAAKSCDQMCDRSNKSDSCDMTCSETVKTCEQRGFIGRLHYRCSRGVKNCTQKAIQAIADMECEAESCKQSCSFSRCGMSCSARTLACMQSQDGFGHEEVNMYCDAGVCRQHCDGSKCNMTCSSSVEECYQTCEQGNCGLARCDAKICYKVKGMSTSTQSPINGISYISWTSLSLHLPIITLASVIFG